MVKILLSILLSHEILSWFWKINFVRYHGSTIKWEDEMRTGFSPLFLKIVKTQEGEEVRGE